MHKINVRFVFRKPQTKKSQLGTVYAIVVVDTKESEPFSTYEKIDKEKWIGTHELSTDFMLNQRLECIRNDIKAYAMAFRHLDITHKLLIDNYLQTVRGVKEEPKKTLIEALTWYEEFKAESISDGTKRTYRTRRKNITKYLNSIKQLKLIAVEFNNVHANRYYDFLINSGCNNVHSVRMITHLSDALKNYASRGFIENNPLENWQMKREVKEDLRCLNTTQLKDLMLWQTKNKTLEAVRDIFLFLCYTGISIIDYKALTKENIKVYNGDVWLLRQRTKTKNEIKQKMHPNAIKLISKYGGQVERLPKLSDQKINIQLKLIDELFDFGISLSTKIGRKTFANLCLNVWNFDLESTALMMGCEVENIKKYARVDFKRVDSVVKWQ